MSPAAGERRRAHQRPAVHHGRREALRSEEDAFPFTAKLESWVASLTFRGGGHLAVAGVPEDENDVAQLPFHLERESADVSG